MTSGGVEKHVERLAVGLVAKGHDVYAYTRPWYTSAKKKQYKGVNLISIGSIRTKNFDTITHTLLASLDVLKRDFDVVHYHGVGPALLAWIPKLFKPSTKVVITFHCIDRYHQKWGYVARLALYFGEWMATHFAHDTITVSKVLQSYCADNFNADTIYIPNGVDVERRVAPQMISKKYGLLTGNYILFLSRLIRHKGAHMLIKAYKELKTDKKLVIAGGSSFTDDYVQELHELADGDKNIIFTGSIHGGSRIWQELYSNAYLFVHPSESEGLPIVVLEAMSFGLPVLASDIVENMEAISGGFGFSFHNKDQQDLKNKLQYLLANRPLVRRVAGEAIKHVQKNYAWNDIVGNVERVYEDVVSGKYGSKIDIKKLKKIGV